MSHDAFLRAIIDQPEDDLPRLVYADYLDDVGDHDRAEFIRVQCELAGMPEADPRRPALEDREHELLGTREQEWLGGDLDDVSEWEFARGFVRSVHADSFQAQLQGVFDRHPITQFSAMTSSDRPDGLLNRDDAWLTRIRSLDQSGARWFQIADYALLLTARFFPSLRDLDLSNNPGIGQLAEVLHLSPIVKQLKSLTFGGRSGINFFWGDATNETLDVARFNQALAHSQIEQLAAFDCGLTNSGLYWMLAAPYAAHLKSLDISDNPIAPDAWRAFRHGRTGMRLGRLDVSGTPLAGISLELLLDSPTVEDLTELEMNRCGSARKNMEVLAASGFWTRAVELRARGGTIPAMTLDPLCQSAGPPGLRILDLGDNYLRAEGVRMLGDAPWAGSLTYLGLSRNYLDDEAARAIAQSGRFTRLRTLHLAHNDIAEEHGQTAITDAGAVALAGAPSLANLRVLTVSHTAVTEAGAAALLESDHWQLFGLGLGGLDLSPAFVKQLASSPRLARFQWLDLSGNPRLSGSDLMPLAESPYLSRLCELDVGNVYADEKTRQALRQRLGPRLSE